LPAGAASGEAVAASRPPLAVRAIDGLSLGAAWLAAAALAALLAMICWDVGLRYLLNEPTSWATEISAYMLVAAATLGTAWTLRQDGHIRVELLLVRLSPPRRRQVELVACWAALGYVAIAAWQAAVLSIDNWLNGTRIFSLLYTPIYLPQIPMAAGLIAFAFAMLAEAWRLAPVEGRRADLVPLLWLAVAVALVPLGLRPPNVPGLAVDCGSALIACALAASVWLWSGWRILLAVLALLLLAGLPFVLLKGAGVGWLVAVQLAVTLFVLVLGVRIGPALGLVGLLGIYLLLPTPAPITVAERTWDGLNSFTLTAVPMFVLMGSLLLRSGLSDLVFEALAKWLGRVPGGIAHAGIGACGIFAAVSGSSVATAATLGMVACPEMTRRGYSPRLAYGAIAAGGTLGILIPPSIPMIIYGSMTGAPVATLFVAGLLPGLLLMAAFSAVVVGWWALRPAAAPRGESYPLGEKLAALVGVLPVVLLVLAVLGVLYAGVATPTEAGALGAAAALLLCLLRRRLSFPGFVETLFETTKVTAFLCVIIVAASVLTYTFDYLRLPQLLVEAVGGAQLEPWAIFLAIAAVYVLLGMFIDSISMMVMTLPVLYPLAQHAGFDPVWFGVVLVILIEIGLITPPVGMNLFVLKGLGHPVTMREIVDGALPFCAVLLACLVLLYLVPDIALWLPRTMAA